MAAPKTKSALVTSYKILVTAEGSKQAQIGQATTFNTSERREISENFVIGAAVPDEPDELIPNPARGKSITMDLIVYYAMPALKIFGRDAQKVVASIIDQNTPVNLQEQITNPNTDEVKTIEYVDCYMQDKSEEKNIGRSDIRVMARTTFIYRAKTETNWV